MPPLAALGLLLLLVTATPLVQWWSQALAGPWDAGTGDVLIILSGDVIDAQTLDVGSYWRTVYGARIYREGNFRKVVVSGMSIAPIMRDQLIHFGVPADRIVVEDDSTSTRENALFTAVLLSGEPGEKVLVTSEMHMYRARRAFAKAGMRVQGAPYPFGAKLGNNPWQRWYLFTELLKESGKIAYYRTKGWI